MANTYHQVYIQTIFAVKYRDAVIRAEWQDMLHGVIGNLINETTCKTLIVNGVEDHVHCLIGLKPVMSISELMKTVKAKSSKHINDHKLTSSRFEWQEGYGVFSYSQSQIDAAYRSFKIRKFIIESRHSERSILSFFRNSMFPTMNNTSLVVCNSL